MKNVKIEIPIVAERPGIALGIFGKEKAREGLLRICEDLELIPHYNFEAEIEGKEGILAIYLFDSEEMAEEAKKRISDAISSMGILGEVDKLRKVGERYLPNFTLKGRILGVDASIIPSERILSHLIAVFKMIGKGLPPVIKKIGEEEGQILARLELKGLKVNDFEDLFQAISLMMKIMECLGELPPAILRREGEEIEIVLSKKFGPYDASRYRIYGLIRGFLREKGIKVEEIPEGPFGVKLRISLSTEEVRVRVVSERI